MLLKLFFQLCTVLKALIRVLLVLLSFYFFKTYFRVPVQESGFFGVGLIV